MANDGIPSHLDIIADVLSYDDKYLKMSRYKLYNMQWGEETEAGHEHHIHNE